MLCAVECRCKCAGYGGRRAVGKSCETETYNAQRQRIHINREKCHSCGKNGDDISRQHGISSAKQVKASACQYSAKAVAYRKHTHESGGNRAVCTYRDSQISCKADYRAAYCGEADEQNKGTPEAESFEHLYGREVNSLKVFLCDGGHLGLGESVLCGGTLKQKTCQGQRNAEGNTEDNVGASPTDRGDVKKNGCKITENKGAGAESHHKTARAEPLLVGKPGIYRGNDKVVNYADATACHKCVGKIEEWGIIGGEKSCENEA